MSKRHYLKTVQPFFDSVWNTEKTFELRRNDRGFQVGDELFLIEYPLLLVEYAETTDKQLGCGRGVLCKVSYVLRSQDLPDTLASALDKDFVILGFNEIQRIPVIITRPDLSALN